MTHIKPSTEELDAQIQASLQELDKEEKPKEEAPVKEEQKQEEKPAEKEEQKEAKEESKEEAPIKQEQKEEAEEDASSIDYKKKFAESTRESVILYHQSKKLLKAIEEANTIPEPTDEEMTKEYSDWELLDDMQKKMAKETVKNRKALLSLGSVVQETKNIEAWNAKVDEYVTDPKVLQVFPGLEGKEDDFRVFAAKETRRGADFELLTQAFLATAKDFRVKNKGSMFEKPSGGPNEKLTKKDDKISLADAEIIKATDYKRWLGLVKANKIQSNID